MRLLLLTLILGALGCDNGAFIKNVAPTVTTVGPVRLESDGVHAYIWIRDHERNAIDLQLDLVTGSTSRRITTATGHGLRGLTTIREPAGEPHLIIFQAADVATDATVRVRVSAKDDAGGAGPTFETAEFTLEQGLPTP